MRKKIAALTLLVGSLFFQQQAHASYATTGSTLVPMTITKTVLDPQKNTYTHSLGLTDSMYHPGDVVTFHITLANMGNVAISEVLIKDTLPSFLTFVSGPGDFSKTANTVSIVANDIAAHTTQTFAVSTRVGDASSLPTNQGIVCTANKVSAKGVSTAVVNDSSSFCIQKSTTALYKAPVVKSTPATGPEALPLIELIGAGLTGLFLRRKTS